MMCGMAPDSLAGAGMRLANTARMQPSDCSHAPSPKAPKLLDRLRTAIRLRHFSRKTEEAYVGWVRRFILFHGKRHPADMGEADVTAFLTYLAEERGVSASTQNQALCALLFLYRQVLGRALGGLDGVVWAKRSVRVPVVLTRDEVVFSIGCRAPPGWWPRCCTERACASPSVSNYG